MRRLFFFFLAASFFFSCKKQDTPANGSNNNNNNNIVTKGTITGKVVTANNTTPVRNAIVFINDGATVYHTYTDVFGTFLLQAPAGQRTLNIQSGTGKIFRTTMTVNVEANKTTAIAANAVKLNQVASLAYVPGSWDKIQAILIDSLGYTATQIALNDLHVGNTVSQYNAIFINCAGAILADPLRDSVLANYVANGGSLYVSDYAVCVLTGSWNASTCPAMRPYGFIPDSKLCTEQIGSSGYVNNALITSSSLQTYLNKNTINVKYDLGQWEMVQNYDTAFWEVMVKHPATMKSLLLRTHHFTNPSAGTITIGNNNTNMVTVCHKPQGTTPVTITIPSSDLALHLAHGDSKGSCQSTNGAGRIYFTTFHTEPNGLISPDMKNILDYIILNL